MSDPLKFILIMLNSVNYDDGLTILSDLKKYYCCSSLFDVTFSKYSCKSKISWSSEGIALHSSYCIIVHKNFRLKTFSIKLCLFSHKDVLRDWRSNIKFSQFG